MTPLARWIKETQRGQRRNRVSVSSDAALTAEWNKAKPRVRERMLQSSIDHNIIAKMAARAGRGRRS